jgi:hypothetical protein
MAAASPPARRWLFGPAPDLLLGCGLLYAIFMTAYAFRGAELRAVTPQFFMPLLILLFSMPHYGATLVRVYEQRRERQRYALFAVYTTLLVLAVSILGVYEAYLGSLLVTVYLTWSPWHYTGQNYGIAVMFLRRRGLSVTPPAKRLLYASFLLSFLLTFVVMHGLGQADYSLADLRSDEVRFMPLGLLPRPLAVALVPALAAACLVCLVGASVLLVRGGRLRDLLPAWVLALTQALWFSIPFGMVAWGRPSGVEPFDVHLSGIDDYRIWTWVGHGVQYLWVTSYYARAEQGWSGYGRYLTKTAVAGIAIWTLPFALFAPDAFGVRSYDGGLALVVAAAINIHHFMLDGAIWKLRNSRIASILIRDDRAAAVEPIGVGRAGWLHAGVWAAATLCVAGAAYVFWAGEVAYRAAWSRRDLVACTRILDRLAWFGRDDETRRYRLGVAEEERRNLAAALRHYERSAELRPSASALGRIGAARASLGDFGAAADAYDALLRLAPDHPDGLLAAAAARLELYDAPAALALLERADSIRPDHAQTRELLARAQQRASTPGETPPAGPSEIRGP